MSSLHEDPIVEEVKIPPHNKECEYCLTNALGIQAACNAAKKLAQADKLMEAANKDMLKRQQELEERVDALEAENKSLKTAKDTSMFWLKVLGILGTVICSGILWWAKMITAIVLK